ncbi:MAG: polysaccharide deacetylase family protein [Alphaproteobacteria bacterium]|nr:polysaccharide deacetylase family protein [Alphaproteobacteria bacterium]
MPHNGTVRTVLDGLFYSGAHRLLAPFVQGIGSFLMLHHVRPGTDKNGFAPNAGLEITPEFLDTVLSHFQERGIEFVSFAEGIRRTKLGVSQKSFAVFTLDDGYLDNFEHAWPIFKRHDCPFTIFIASDITDGTSELWWQILEQAIAASTSLSAQVAGDTISCQTATAAQKQQAYEKLYKQVRWGLEEQEQRKWIRSFAETQGIDVQAHCRAEAMTWDQVREINEDPLCTIGAHTVHHYAVGRMSEEDAYLEMLLSRGRIAEELGAAPAYFCYPYGDEVSAGARDFALAKKAGFEAAVTTRKGMIYPGHAEHLLALPRVSLNGAFQHVRYVDVLMSGLPFMLANKFRAVNAA